MMMMMMMMMMMVMMMMMMMMTLMMKEEEEEEEEEDYNDPAPGPLVQCPLKIVNMKEVWRFVHFNGFQNNLSISALASAAHANRINCDCNAIL